MRVARPQFDRVQPFTGLVALAIFATASQCLAQSATDQETKPVSYESGSSIPSAADGRGITFDRRMPLVGDQLEQSLATSLNLDTIVRQQGEVFNRGKMAVEREHRRLVTTTDVADGMTRAVTVRYLEATKTSAAGQTDADLADAVHVPQPVEGKVYHCRRDGEKLTITDEAGNIPPLDEYEIVAGNMESLGRPNPLAEFLANRTVKIGDELAMPLDVAEKLLGMGKEMGAISSFTLKLDDIREIDGAECAVFHAAIVATSADASQMRLEVDGPLTIQADTCRAVEADFSGPIGMSETRGSLTATYQMTGTGRMHVEIGSTYRDVTR